MLVGELKTVLAAALQALATHSDELRDLDAALGDGDLGITVRAGSLAAVEALATSDSDDAAEVLKAAGRAFAAANPSTFSALVGGGLMAAASPLAGRDHLDTEAALAFGRAAAERIHQRGKAELGDKTLLDALLPSLDVLATASGSAAERCRVMATEADRCVAASREWESKRGRAGWLGERSIGQIDAGARAYALFLAEFAAALERS